MQHKLSGTWNRYTIQSIKNGNIFHKRLGALMNFGWAVVLLMSAWIFINQGWGAYGLATAYLIAYAFHALWTFGFAFKILQK